MKRSVATVATVTVGTVVVLGLGIAGAPGVGASTPPRGWMHEGSWQQESGGRVALVDDSGVRVELPRQVRRIVSLAPSNTETLFHIGAGDLLVGATRFDEHPPEAAAVPRVGGFADIDVERVLALRPDLVLAAGFHAGGVAPRLRGLGLTVFVIEPRDAAEAIDRVELLGRIVGREARARNAARRLRQRMARVQARVVGARGRPRVLYQLSRDLYSAGPGSFPHDLIVRAGGANIAASAGDRYPRLSEEFVIAADPEVIFVAGHESGVTAAELRARPGWAGIAAVRTRRIVVLEDPDLAGRPGPRIVEALEIIARAIHPEAFTPAGVDDREDLGSGPSEDGVGRRPEPTSVRIPAPAPLTLALAASRGRRP
ncbi:MAG TPA: cobalamin-binding protein [Acidobacteriota bacterium]